MCARPGSLPRRTLTTDQGGKPASIRETPDMVDFTSSKPPQQLYLAPDVSRESSPRPSSAFEDFTLFDAPDSRRNSGVFTSSASSPRSTMGSNPPTLIEILLDAAPPPWTLSAFTAFLSQNHCMETLEFTLDLQRYAAAYDQVYACSPVDPAATAHLCTLWDKLMQVYIVPCSPREVNIPSRVRDRLLRFPGQPEPPHPRELEEAGRIIHELMNDSLLVPFLESVSPMNLDAAASSANPSSSRYPPYLDANAAGSRSTSVHGLDSEGLTDDSDGNSPPAMEPMTPPTTPPTSTDGASSSGGLHRAMAAHSKGWKRVGAKLGFNRRPATQQRTPPTSSVPADDYVTRDHGNNPL